MNKKENEAYRFYKDRYPGSVVLFHLGFDLVALGDDAEMLDNVLREHSGIPSGWIDDMAFIDASFAAAAMKILGEQHLKVVVVACRNEDGAHDIPDIECLDQEKIDDY